VEREGEKIIPGGKPIDSRELTDQFSRPSVETKSRITRHALAFWFGIIYILAGVSCHLPDYISHRGQHFHLSGLPMSNMMLFGMCLIVAGIASTAYGLFPVRDHAKDASADYELKSMDNARLSAAHWLLVAVMGVALVVDVMKPATLGFVLPGMRREYGISVKESALLPLIALIGTTLGSLFWGILADRLGRRGAILLASLIFISTGICGCMPAFKWNLFMCFIMGLSAGGMLPIVFALLAEMVPARHRGWLSVLIGGLGTSGGYLAASGAAGWLEPLFSWRILWLLNVPTGLLVILLSRFIPESPRFLLHMGRIAEAENTLARFNIKLVRRAVSEHGEVVKHSMGQLFRKPYAAATLAVCIYGVAWGLVNWGFVLMLPTIMQDYLQLDAKIANRLLAKSALIAVPGCMVVSWLYGFWSSKRTLVLFAIGTSCVLAAFAMIKSGAGYNQLLFSALTVMLLVGLSGMISMLPPYSVELYPTKLRATGGGLTASSSKLGGVLGPGAVTLILTAFPGFMVPALSLAVPLLIAAVALWINGRETSGRRLEEIHEAAAPTAELTGRPGV
jgi:putative MFS transporter